MNISLPVRQSHEPLRSHWLEQTLERIDDELIREDARDDPPFISGELIEFREYLRDELEDCRTFAVPAGN